MAPPTAAAPATTATTVINTQYGAQPVDLINDNNNPYVTLDDGDGIESVNINGKYFGYGAKGSGYGGGTGEIDFNLSRAFKTFKTRIGITDESGASCSTEIQIVDDGRTVVDHTLGLGQSQDVTVNVTGVLRVQVIFANTNNPGPGNCYAAIGNPTATPAAG